jgi:hypothetical protein
MRQVPLDFHSDGRTGLVRAGRLLSDLLSPPAAFAAAGLAMGWLDRPGLVGLSWGFLYGFLASLLPIVFVVYSYRAGRVSDLHMSNPQERQAPYLIGLAGAGLAWLLVRAYAGSPLLQGLVLCHIVLTVGLTMWNFFHLISAHAASLTAIALYAGIVLGLPAGLLLAPLVGLIFYVRYYLRRHTLGELVLGLATGAAAVGLLAATGAFRS